MLAITTEPTVNLAICYYTRVYLYIGQHLFNIKSGFEKVNFGLILRLETSIINIYLRLLY